MSLRKNSMAALVGMLFIGQAAFGSTIGNPLINYGNTDGDAPTVILGEYNATAPTATSTISIPQTGVVTAIQTYDTSAGQTFDTYILQPAGTDSNGNQQFKVLYDS